jgi:DNA-binding transcriptional LysR family regulator
MTPHISVHVHEVPMTQKIYELRSGFLDAALAPESGYGKGIASEAIWQDPLIAVIPRSHPLATTKRIALHDVVREPLVLCRPDTGLGQQCQIEQIVRTVTATPNIVEPATTLCMLVTLVFAGYGVGIATAAQLEAVSASELVLRPLSDTPTLVKTWLMVRQETPVEALARFIEHARRLA